MALIVDCSSIMGQDRLLFSVGTSIPGPSNLEFSPDSSSQTGYCKRKYVCEGIASREVLTLSPVWGGDVSPNPGRIGNRQ